MQHSPAQDGACLDVGEAFADPVFTALKAHGAAFAVVCPDPGSVVWANAAAAVHWGVESATALGVALFGPEGRGGWLDGIARGVVPGRAARLARTGLARGFRMRAHTALIRAWTDPRGAVLIGFAVPESVASREVHADAWRQPAWRPEPPAVPEGDGSSESAVEAAGTRHGDEAGSGRSLARRSQIAVLRDRLHLALDGAGSRRLLWRTDAQGVVTQIDAATLAGLGSPVRFDDRPFPDVVSWFDPAGATGLAAALASRATWSGLTLDLPVADAAATVPMVLSASPVFGPGRSFAGFRGFGAFDLARLDLAPPRGPVETNRPEAAPAVPAGEADRNPGQTIVSPPPTQLPGVVARPREAPAQELVPPPANVVQLRAFQAMASGRFGTLPGLAPRVDPRGDGPPKRDPERDRNIEEAAEAIESPLSDDLAFAALGEALRAHIERQPGAPELSEAAAPQAITGAIEAPTGPIRAPEDIRASHGGDRPEPDGRTGEAPMFMDIQANGPASLLDRLPVALLIVAGRVPVYANALAAARLGYASPDAVLASGRDLVVARPEPADTGALALRHAKGHTLVLTGQGAPVSFAGASATVWVLDDRAESGATAEGRGGDSPADEAEVRAVELLDRVDDAVALLDGSGHICRLNRRGENWFGREAAVGQSFADLLAPESRPPALALLGEVRHQRAGLGLPPLRREVLARTGGAMPTPMLLTLGRLGAAGFYATLRDVTPLKRAETDGAQREQARDAGRLSDMLAKVSHDIRTPLNAILGFAEVMMDERFGPLGNARYKEYLKDIHTSGTQVMTLVEGLIDLSRIEAGHLDLDVAAVDVNRIVAETVAQMQPEAHRERVIMRTSLGGRIPWVLADGRSVRQIVRNLLSNAVKFNEPGGQVIVSTALSESGTVILRVRDTGVGMTDGEIAAALDPFGESASPHPANGNGNGLGLPLTRALVGANGASMAIRSRPSEGTLVEVAFVAAVAENARLPA